MLASGPSLAAFPALLGSNSEEQTNHMKNPYASKLKKNKTFYAIYLKHSGGTEKSVCVEELEAY